MPTKKRWIATVYYACEQLGNIDVDYGVDDLAQVHVLIMRGPGYAAVKFTTIHRNPAFDHELMTLEELAENDPYEPPAAAERQQLDEPRAGTKPPRTPGVGEAAFDDPVGDS
jgi:hypothetical protein